MHDAKKNDELLNKIYRNAHIALQSISNVMPEVAEGPIKKELSDEYDGYEKIIGEISTEMARVGAEPKDIGVLKKTMLWSSIKMKTLADNSQNHIADMMLQGTIMGITELLTIKSENDGQMQEGTANLVNKLLELEESYEEKLKTYL